MPSRDDYRVLNFAVKGKGRDAEQVNFAGCPVDEVISKTGTLMRVACIL